MNKKPFVNNQPGDLCVNEPGLSVGFAGRVVSPGQDYERNGMDL